MKTAGILLVEDEAIIAMQIISDLEMMGYTVAGVHASGEEALAAIAALRPDLVLMDIKLQGPLDGIETAASLAKEHDIPVIFLTAHSEEVTIGRAMATSPYGYLLKPVDAQDLHVAIRMALEKSEQERRLRYETGERKRAEMEVRKPHRKCLETRRGEVEQD